MAIVVRDLHHVYNPGTPLATPSLRGVSLTVEEGAFVALIGTMGSGKSTLLQHLNGLIVPPPGAVTVDGLDVGDARHVLEVRRRVGVVFQYPEQQLFADTVAADVAFGPRNLGLAEDEVAARVREALAWVGLDYDQVQGRSPWSLSGGQQRRVALAGVLAMEPRYLVLDEPTVGLDPEGRRELLALLQRWRTERGGAVVLATHHLDDAARLADHVVVLSGGRVALSGPPGRVLSAERAGELRRLGLDAPPAARLVEELRRRGWRLPDGIVTEEAAVAAVLAARKDGGGHVP
ncbi:MAG: energy-coupling factor ABC transporter ATP-binding protein [Bacillota bacterium]|nr:MAG: energy-coupling factor ABC transporter ATP-binding protein [Bacillota bacterium]